MLVSEVLRLNCLRGSDYTHSTDESDHIVAIAACPLVAQQIGELWPGTDEIIPAILGRHSQACEV